MKRIALVSTYNYNYGSVLQAFALQNKLKEMGIYAEIINYRKKTDMRQILRIFNYTLLIAKLNGIVRNLYIKLSVKRYRSEKIKRNKFKKFLDEYLFFSKEIIGYEMLKKEIQQYDGVILGSDQLWNPINMGTGFFTLEFVPFEIKRCTYATSFGVSKLSEKNIKIMKSVLNNIDYISVREHTGKQIVDDILDRNKARVDIDPTLLYGEDEWNNFISDNESYKNKKYILAYFIGKNAKCRKFLKEFAERRGLEIRLFPHVDQLVRSDIFFENEQVMSAGPCDFVNAIRHAEFVFTDSFHGCIFSIIYKKEFFVFKRFLHENRKSMNSRVSNLLNNLGLENRLVHDVNDINNLLNVGINYQEVYCKLDKLKMCSNKYLNTIAIFLNE